MSGGQRRRLQILLLLLDEPNVIILDEPTNDVDADMLAVLEDLLDSWPGTLIVVSHDRYLVERVTDQQYALLDGRLRHVPGGVDEYLRLRAAERAAAERARTGADAAGPSDAELRALQKESRAIERRMDRLAEQDRALQERMAAADQSDYEELATMTERLQALRDESAALEDRWLELAERIG